MNGLPPTADREEWAHLFEERAAVLQFEARKSREVAAREDLGRRWKRARRFEEGRE